ncbi:MAG: metallophosphoesterase family protein [Hyphomicrobiales bacterium]|nr:metallophosphoesterase family protein [Hyphomicrobiales bacterium]
MARIFFSSDTHFGDPNVIRIRKRPFASVAEMDAVLIENWNRTIAPDDTVYHLGDFAHRNCEDAADYLDRLNGTIHLVRGNHDDKAVEQAADRFASVELIRILEWNDWRFVLFHYPMRDWADAVRGACHLFGHVHGSLDATPFGRSLDVGVESHGYAPVSIETVVSILDRRPQHSRGLPPVLVQAAE